MAELRGYITTFNCGRKPVNIDYFAAHLFAGLKTNLPPDLLVLSLQEIAPIGYSFLGGSFLTPYFTSLETAVRIAAVRQFDNEDEYRRLLVRNVGMTAMMVFVRREFEERIRRVETSGVGVGLWRMGNKGGVGARLWLQAQSEGEAMAVTFVAAHFAPMEDAWQARIEDWKCICEEMVFEGDRSSKGQTEAQESQALLGKDTDVNVSDDKQQSLFSPISHIFFAGDLNYRAADKPPVSGDYEGWPQPVESESDVHHYSHLLDRDQLTRELEKNTTLHHLAEAAIHFPPTYKYSNEAQKEAAKTARDKSLESDNSAWLWAEHRVPSWCDRVLFLKTAKPTVHSYTALPLQPTSDHRPVVLSFSIPLKPMDKEAAEVTAPFAVRKDWRELRAAARRYEILVGLAAYLSLTWEGEMLLGGTIVGIIGGWLAIRALVGT